MITATVLTREDTSVGEGKPKILLVDDMEANLLALDSLLRREEIELLHARSGRDALELLLVEEFALAIIDVQMPLMNGFELAELMRGTERTRGIPIVFITAGAQNQQHRFRGYEAGAVDFLYKPIEPDVLRCKVAVFVDLYRSRQEITLQRDQLEHGRRVLAAELEAARQLQELSTRLIQAGDLNALYEGILDTAVTIMKSDGAKLQVVCGQDGLMELQLLGYRGFPPRAAEFWSTVNTRFGCISARALDTGRRVIVPDLEEYGLVDCANREMYRVSGIRAAQATPLYSRGGHFLGMISTHWREPHHPAERELRLLDVVARQAADLIERTRIEADLRRLNEDLNHFAFAASHDLQEPLRMIGTYSQLLVKTTTDQPDADVALFVNYINEGIERMRTLLSDLLSYTQVTQGRETSLELVDLNLARDAATQNLRTLIEETGAEISSSVLPGIYGHTTHFVQLFQNLIGNALKYRAEQPPRVRISAERQGARWQVAVADNGMGIAPQFHEQIFGVFKRLHGQNIPGTGVGLAICQRIVERYRGRIWVESETDQGATFYFTLSATER